MARKKKVVEEVKEEVVETPVEEVKTKKTRKKKVVEEVKEEVVETPVEEIKEEPKKEIVAEEVNPELTISEMPETVTENKKEYNVSDVIRKYIIGEPVRVFEGTLTFGSLNEFIDNKWNVVIGDLDIRKFTVNIPTLPKVIFGNILANKNAVLTKMPAFLGGKVIKK